MHIKKSLYLTTIGLFICFMVASQGRFAPSVLSVNLLSKPEAVFLNGYRVSTPLSEAITQKENFQFTEISTHAPLLGWVISSDTKQKKQTAYRIWVASDKKILLNDSADLWDTEKVYSSHSSDVLYNGKPLEPGKVYFWKVKIWDNDHQESAFSDISSF